MNVKITGKTAKEQKKREKKKLGRKERKQLGKSVNLPSSY